MLPDRKRDSKRPLVFVRPDDGQTEKDVVEALVTPLVAVANAWRRSNGLGPLPEDHTRLGVGRPRMGRSPARRRR
jgi:hypothetical protein